MAIRTGQNRLAQDAANEKKKLENTVNNNAFNTMNAKDPDFNMMKGAISASEYEQNMNPDEQRRYEKLLLDRFLKAFKRDPYKASGVAFKNWIKTIDPELFRNRAAKYDSIKAANHGRIKFRNMDPENQAMIEDAGLLQDLAHLHTGRIEDLIEIVGDLDPGIKPSDANMPFSTVGQ